MAKYVQKMDVIVLGELNIDLILDKVESFPELEKEKIAGDMNLTMGSSSAIFASNCSRLGAETAFCGMIGNDSFGEFILEELESYGVDTSSIVKEDQAKTGLTAIIRHSGQRAMVTYPGTMATFSSTHIPDNLFQQARHLHISSIFLQPHIQRDLLKIVKKAKGQGLTISIDPQWDPAEKWDINLTALLDHIDFLLPNKSEFLALANADTVKQGLMNLASSAAKIIVKRGTKGASFLSGGQVKTIPAYLNQDPVDAIGAGDSFDAGFIYRFLQGKSVEQSVKFANLTGAVSTTKAGGTAAMTSFEEVTRIAKDKFSLNITNELTK